MRSTVHSRVRTVQESYYSMNTSYKSGSALQTKMPSTLYTECCRFYGASVCHGSKRWDHVGLVSRMLLTTCRRGGRIFGNPFVCCFNWYAYRLLWYSLPAMRSLVTEIFAPNLCLSLVHLYVVLSSALPRTKCDGVTKKRHSPP
jgi:hypothetical protein